MAAEDFATLAARLSSFDAVIKFSRKIVKWPRDAPSPEDLAAAGFFWKPSTSSHDNTQCFLCERALDSWEKDDSPLAEHLKHSPECGWAAIMEVSQDGAGPATMEDPTDARLLAARKATFANLWPHEGKRGWLCKTAALSAAGWHFAPTPESDDFVSCAYCKLSLDGWEPKDSPFDEHYRRSPDCPFFAFAGTTAPKTARGKKARASKVSRLSTQSTMTSASEGPSIPDLDESIDASTLSINTVASSVSAVSNKKSLKNKGRNARTSRQEVVPVEVEPPVAQRETAQANTEVPHGKKRTSDLISEDDRAYREGTVKPEPPAKRRNTQTRGSVIEQAAYPLLQDEPDSMTVDAGSQKPVRGSKKRASSRTRRNSAASSASLRAVIPDNVAIEAELEADLDQPMSDEEQPVVLEEPPKKRGRKPKATRASTASARGPRAALLEQEVPELEAKAHSVEDSELQVTYNTDIEGPAPTRSKNTKTKASEKLMTKRTKRTYRGSAESNPTVATELETQLDSSMMTTRTEADDSGHETDASVGGKSIVRKGSKRKAAGKGRGKKGGSGMMSKNIEDIVQLQPQNQTIPALVAATQAAPDPGAAVDEDLEGINLHRPTVPSAAKVETFTQDEQAPKKPTRNAMKVGKAKQNRTKKPKSADKPPQLSMPGAFSPLMPGQEQDAEPSFASVLSPTSPPVLTRPINNINDAASLHTNSSSVPVIPPQLPPRSPLRNMNSSARATPTPQRNNIPREQNETTPSPSLQSSDAENAPPSTRPPSARPPLVPLSPSKNQIVHVALAPGTPRGVPLSPSKIGGGLRSDIPWTSVDVEMVFATTTPDVEKENMDVFGALGVDLTSPEKEMTVEEWINWNAQKAEEALRTETERVVGVFEKEGGRALRVLEGIEVLD